MPAHLTATAARDFCTTHWSVVLAAGGAASPDARGALECLCRTYWPPLYSFIRRQGYSAADAQDLTQSFLAHLLARDSLKSVSPHKGRFRSFLLAALRHFLADDWDKVRAQKRGGGLLPISLDAERAEQRYAAEPLDERDPGRLYERRWALTLLEDVLGRVESEMVAAGNEVRWRELQACLLGGAPSYAEIAGRLATTEAAVKMAVVRLRQRFREVLRAQIAETVDSEAEAEDELRHLFAILGR